MKNYFKISVLLLCMTFALASCRNEEKKTPVENAMENIDADADVKVKEDKVKIQDEDTKVKIKTDEDGSVEKIKTKETE